jgi:hypothetical protein
VITPPVLIKDRVATSIDYVLAHTRFMRLHKLSSFDSNKNSGGLIFR